MTFLADRTHGMYILLVHISSVHICSVEVVLSLGESNTLASDVVDLAVSSNPGVSEDPGGTESEAVHSEESDSALTVVKFQVEDVLDRGNVVVLSVDGEDEVGKSLHASARDGVELVDRIISGTKLLDNLEGSYKSVLIQFLRWTEWSWGFPSRRYRCQR